MPRSGSSPRPSAASSSRPTSRTRRPRSSSPRTPACSTRTRTCRRRARSSSSTGGYLVDASGKVGTQTLERWTGYSKFLYDQGLLADDDRQAADGAARLRLAVHERLPAVTRRPRRRLGAGSGPPLAPRRAPARSPGRPTPGRRASARSSCRRRARSSGRSGSSAARRSATPSRRSSRRWSGFSLSIAARHRGRDRPRPGRAGRGRRSSRCSSARRRSRSSRSRRSSSSGSGSGSCRRSSSSILVTFFPITIALLDGFASTPAEATELLRSFGATAGRDVPQGPLAVGPAGVLHRAPDLGDATR